MNNPPPPVPENPGKPANPDQSLEDYARLFLPSDEQQLWSMLVDIQNRLGSSVEQPDDLEQARAIAHRLSNSLTAIRLKTEIARTKREANNPWPAPCSGQCCGI